MLKSLKKASLIRGGRGAACGPESHGGSQSVSGALLSLQPAISAWWVIRRSHSESESGGNGESSNGGGSESTGEFGNGSGGVDSLIGSVVPGVGVLVLLVSEVSGGGLNGGVLSDVVEEVDRRDFSGDGDERLESGVSGVGDKEVGVSVSGNNGEVGEVGGGLDGCSHGKGIGKDTGMMISSEEDSGGSSEGVVVVGGNEPAAGVIGTDHESEGGGVTVVLVDVSLGFGVSGLGFLSGPLGVGFPSIGVTPDLDVAFGLEGLSGSLTGPDKLSHSIKV